MKKLRVLKTTILTGLLLVLSSFFIGCSQKNEVLPPIKELVCNKQTAVNDIEFSKIYFINPISCDKNDNDCKEIKQDIDKFNKEQAELINSERKEVKGKLKYYEEQVKRNNELCISQSREIEER